MLASGFLFLQQAHCFRRMVGHEERPLSSSSSVLERYPSLKSISIVGTSADGEAFRDNAFECGGSRQSWDPGIVVRGPSPVPLTASFKVLSWMKYLERKRKQSLTVNP